MGDYKVTIIFDYSTDIDDVDEDELHDAIVDSFDVVDLEGQYEAMLYDDDGNELDGTATVSFNADNLRSCKVEKVES